MFSQTNELVVVHTDRVTTALTGKWTRETNFCFLPSNGPCSATFNIFSICLALTISVCPANERCLTWPDVTPWNDISDVCGRNHLSCGHCPQPPPNHRVEVLSRGWSVLFGRSRMSHAATNDFQNGNLFKTINHVSSDHNQIVPLFELLHFPARRRDLCTNSKGRVSRLIANQLIQGILTWYSLMPLKKDQKNEDWRLHSKLHYSPKHWVTCVHHVGVTSFGR